MIEKAKVFLPNEDSEKVGRRIVSFLNTCEKKPVLSIKYEYLQDDTVGMCVSTIQGAYKTKQYIVGGYEAQYQFKLIYRNQPSDTSERIEADEILNDIASWAEAHAKEIELEGAIVRKLRRDSNSALYAVYEDGSQDNQILMTLTYEVI